ncbi:MAG: hypothetical protein RI897_2151, partial [Verrucomicrobiota bacterium]
MASKLSYSRPFASIRGWKALIPIRVHWRPFAVGKLPSLSASVSVHSRSTTEVRSQESKAITRPNHTASIRVYQHPFMVSKLS